MRIELVMGEQPSGPSGYTGFIYHLYRDSWLDSIVSQDCLAACLKEVHYTMKY